MPVCFALMPLKRKQITTFRRLTISKVIYSRVFVRISACIRRNTYVTYWPGVSNRRGRHDCREVLPQPSRGWEWGICSYDGYFIYYRFIRTSPRGSQHKLEWVLWVRNSYFDLGLKLALTLWARGWNLNQNQLTIFVLWTFYLPQDENENKFM